jgi:hypothetical protein
LTIVMKNFKINLINFNLNFKYIVDEDKKAQIRNKHFCVPTLFACST